MVDVRRTMPMLLHLRCADILQIQANQRSNGFHLLWSCEKRADIALNVAHPVDSKLLSSRCGRRTEATAVACIQKQLTSIQAPGTSAPRHSREIEKLILKLVTFFWVLFKVEKTLFEKFSPPPHTPRPPIRGHFWFDWQAEPA